MSPEITIFFDGSCGPKNPGGTAKYAWIMYRDGEKYQEDSQVVCSGPEATNNIGEWAGVTNALRRLKADGHSGKVHIKGDSQLVIYQLTGIYKCKKDTLKPYYNECLELLTNWEWTATWIAREQNQEADTLSK